MELDLKDLANSQIRILLVDNQTLTRAGLVYIIACQPDMKVVGETGDAKVALDLVARQRPEIVLFDLNPLSGLGLELIPAFLNTCLRTRVILLTNVDDSEVYIQAVQNGAFGVVKKTQSPEILIKAIRKVQQGEAWLDHTLIGNLLINFALGHPFTPIASENEHIAQLTDRERQVIQLIGRGLKNQLIAKHLCISETTVRHHLTSIYSKLGVSDRLELLVFAQRYGLNRNSV